MLFYKKLLIVFILFAASYIIWHLIKEQSDVMRMKDILLKKSQTTEGMTDSSGNSMNYLPSIITTQNSEIQSLQNTFSASVTLKPMQNSQYGNLALQQFIVKGSYNSAVTGNYVNKNMIKLLLSRGCRYLDFEIFSVNQQVVVSYSTDPTFQVLSTDNLISWEEVLSTVITNLNYAPNQGDPLFINMRVKSNTDPSIYQNIASSVDKHLSSLLYKGPVTNNTPISKLNNHIVLMIDKTINPDYAKLCDCANSQNNPCYDLRKYINMEVGGETLFQQPYTQLLNQSWNTPMITDYATNMTNVQKMRIIVPDPILQKPSGRGTPPPASPYQSANPPLSPFIIQAGCQFVPYRFYLADPTSYLGMVQGSTNLADYEAFFNYYKSAFVPLAMAITNCSKGTCIPSSLEIASGKGGAPVF
jgi:hypothetical protein